MGLLISILKLNIIKEINSSPFQSLEISLIEDKGRSKEIRIYRNDNYECIYGDGLICDLL